MAEARPPPDPKALLTAKQAPFDDLLLCHAKEQCELWLSTAKGQMEIKRLGRLMQLCDDLIAIRHAAQVRREERDRQRRSFPRSRP